MGLTARQKKRIETHLVEMGFIMAIIIIVGAVVTIARSQGF